MMFAQAAQSQPGGGWLATPRHTPIPCLRNLCLCSTCAQQWFPPGQTQRPSAPGATAAEQPVGTRLPERLLQAQAITHSQPYRDTSAGATCLLKDGCGGGTGGHRKRRRLQEAAGQDRPGYSAEEARLMNASVGESGPLHRTRRRVGQCRACKQGGCKGRVHLCPALCWSPGGPTGDACQLL